MPKIKMLKSDKGTDDGINVQDFDCGKEYEVSEFLCNEFVNRRHTAILVEVSAPVDMGRGSESYSFEDSAVTVAPENKAIVPEKNKKKKVK